jgi:tetratricopeptide (TPR) repeat protein
LLHEPQAALLIQTARREFSQGRRDAAEASCLGILRRFPEHAGALHLLGVIALDSGRGKAAEAWLRRAAESAVTLPLYILTYAELVLRHRNQRTALALTRRALALDSGAAVGWFALGDQLLDLREYAESKACFDRALVLDPGQWQARARLSILLVRTGNVSDGVARFEQVLRADPENADIIASHAALLEELGHFSEALVEVECAIRKAPRKLDHHLHAVSIEMQLGRYNAALARLEGPAAWADDIRSIVLRATLLRMVDRLDDAVALCSDALANGWESAELLRTLALALHLDGATDAAIELLERAAVDRPGTALADQGLLLSQAGRLDDATAAFERALQHEPRLVEAWYNRSLIKTHRQDDPDIDAMETILGGHCAFGERLLLHFALGKAHLDAGNRAAAFAHWERGNRMKRSVTAYEATATAREFAAIIAQSRSVAAVADVAEDAGAQLTEVPVFIVGMPRCGSSLLEHILASHPAVHGAGEQTGLRRLLQGNTGTEHDLATAAIARLRRHSSDAARIIDKDLQNFKHLGVIHRVFPRARIIHCRRDPVDMCFSAYTQLFLGDWPFTYDLRELGLYYREYHALMRHWRSQLPDQVFMEVDYEALVSSPLETTRRVVAFLGLPWSAACMRFVETRRSVNTASLTQVRQPLYSSSIGRGRGWLPDLAPLIEALGDVQPPRATVR